jgi:hypothetical protein
MVTSQTSIILFCKDNSMAGSSTALFPKIRASNETKVTRRF